MKIDKLRILLILLIAVVAASSIWAQDTVFADPSVEYSFIVPDTKWRLTVRPSATNPNVEYVYGDRRDGLLTVRKVSVAKDSMLSDLIESEGIDKLQFTPGFVAGKQENFAGKLRGTVFNYEYLAAGKAMSGRFYFLRANDTTVYVLRFQGDKNIIRSIRNETDQIGRTFFIKS